MNTKEIEQLLGKYFEGETSLLEEKLLKEFFSGDDIPEDFRQYQPMFSFFNSEASLSLSDEQQERVLERRLEQYREETSAVKSHPGKKRLYYFSGIAAGLLLLAALVFTLRNEIGRRHHHELSNPEAEVAYAQTKQALLLVSVGLNTGLDAIQRLGTLNNAMEQVQKINKFYNYQNQFINPEWMQSPSTNK
jgi:hypothetical protein